MIPASLIAALNRILPEGIVAWDPDAEPVMVRTDLDNYGRVWAQGEVLGRHWRVEKVLSPALCAEGDEEIARYLAVVIEDAFRVAALESLVGPGESGS